MSEKPDDILPYGRSPSASDQIVAFGRRNLRRASILIGLLILGYGVIHGPRNGQIRLDTGDLRYCWWGIPLEYDEMPEPQRSKIVALAKKSSAVPAIWVMCVRYPKDTTNNLDIMYQGFYRRIAWQAGEDPDLAKWQLEDVAATIQNPTHAPESMR
jgi:hypothetical protein